MKFMSRVPDGGSMTHVLVCPTADCVKMFEVFCNAFAYYAQGLPQSKQNTCPDRSSNKAQFLSLGRKGCLVIANDLNPAAILFAQQNAKLYLGLFSILFGYFDWFDTVSSRVPYSGKPENALPRLTHPLSQEQIEHNHSLHGRPRTTARYSLRHIWLGSRSFNAFDIETTPTSHCLQLTRVGASDPLR